MTYPNEFPEEKDNRETKIMYRFHLDVKEKGKWKGHVGAPLDERKLLDNYIKEKIESGYTMFRIRIDTIYYKEFPDSLNPKEVVEIIRGS